MAMPNSDKKAEIKQPKKTAKESVDGLIKKNKVNKSAEASESAAAKMESTQGEVADVMEGAEKPSETISEKAGEKGEKKGSTGIKSGTAGDDDDDAQVGDIQLKQYVFPSDEIMVKKIRSAINMQIKAELKKAKKYQGQLGTGGAANYNMAIAKVRALKHILSGLFISAAGFLKDMYTKYFLPNGKRKRIEDIS